MRLSARASRGKTMRSANQEKKNVPTASTNNQSANSLDRNVSCITCVTHSEGMNSI